MLLPALPSAVVPTTTPSTLLWPLEQLFAAGGAGADSFVFTAELLAAAFWLDPVTTPSTSVMAIPIATTTYYFGKTDGKDTLSFATTTAGTNLVVAIDAAYGATSGFTYGGNLDAATGTMGSVTFADAESGVATGTLFFNNVTGSVDAVGAGFLEVSASLSSLSLLRRSLPLADRQPIKRKMGSFGTPFFCIRNS